MKASDWIDIEVPDRYPVPEIGRNEYRAPFFGRSFIPDGPGARSGHGDNIYVEDVTRLDGERHLRIHLPQPGQDLTILEIDKIGS